THLFEQAGYRTASFGKQDYLTGSLPAFQTQQQLVLSEEVGYFGYAKHWNQSDFDVVQYPPEPYPWLLAGRFPADPAQTAEAQAAVGAKRWLEPQRGDCPFLLQVSFNGPHTPVVPPAPFDTCIDPDGIALPPAADPLPPAAPQWVHDYARYTSAS